jgi:putative acetyltransferase
MMIIEKFSAASREVQEVIARLDQALLERYEASDIHGIDGEEFDRSGGYFVICRDNHRSLGCGAFRPIDGSVAEVKRMFVESACRGRGIAKAILLHLEDEMRRRGFETAVLETGVKQPEAIGLYRSMGYIPIPTFGAYVGGKYSLCFAKDLRGRLADGRKEEPTQAPGPARSTSHASGGQAHGQAGLPPMTVDKNPKQMRRKDKEVTDAKIINEILTSAEVCRLAMVDDGQPYVRDMVPKLRERYLAERNPRFVASLTRTLK